MSRRKHEEIKDRPRIIMVDNDHDMITVGREWLASRYDFVGLPSGEALLKTLEKTTPDIIILDVNMPGLDGFALCGKLQLQKRWADIPVLFLTASKDSRSCAKGFEAGGVFYLTKPTTREEMLSTLSLILLAGGTPRPRGGAGRASFGGT